MNVSRTLPPRVAKYAETAKFTRETVPSKLTTRHNLKSGVWGLLCVEAGTVEFHVTGGTTWSASVQAGETIVIEPRQEHFVRPDVDAEFKVEFYR